MFRRNESGSVALLFALMLPALMAAVGGGIDVSRAVEYKQRLTSVADLTCRQAEVWVEGTYSDNPTKNYATDIQGYADKNKSEKGLTTATITAVGLAKPVAPTSIYVTATGSADLVFKNFLPKSAMSFTVTRTCLVDLTNATGPATLVFSESFEDNHSVATNSWTVLKNWNGWNTTNAGIEINGQSALTGDSIKFGSFFAELDSDCGTSANTGVRNCQANSAMSKLVTLDAGTYVIKYWYVARKKNDIPYPNYSVICSNSAWNNDTIKSTMGIDRNADVSWATADQQTRRIETYVERNDGTSSGGYLDFTQDFTKNVYLYSEMADVCIWADNWTERTYTFHVASRAEYRITWRAAGLQDTYGGLIDYLRLCRNSCP